MVKRKMTGTKFDIEKFDGKNDFALWQKKLYTFHMHPGKSQSEHIDEFHKLVGDLAAIDAAISDKDQALLLLTSLPSSYDNFVENLLYGRDTIKLEDVVVTLNSRELQKMMEAKGDGGEGFYVSERSGQRDMEQGTYSTWSKSQGRSSGLKCYICQSEENLKRDCPRYNHKKSQGFVRNDQVSGYGAMGNAVYGETCKVQVQMRDGSSFVLDNVRYIPELRRNLISMGTLEKEFTVKMQSGKIKVKKGSLMVLSGTRRSNCVYTLDGQVVTRNTLKGKKQLGEYQIGWKIKTGNVLDSRNQRSTQQRIKSGVTKHLGVAGIQQQNGLVNETNVTLFAKKAKQECRIDYGPWITIELTRIASLAIRDRDICASFVRTISAQPNFSCASLPANVAF
ncbi:hypothetical protein Tco_0875263 [Tanacetum coccineum]|uniref:Retrovirus-related Pol polyprotein from transposon TNT 1-94-like beta-barrel domain-containing protein n=1 Tax=Tanacetum coccineum TaxID=301880 RepID=A0ABQ5BRY1_9ASTR